MTVPYWVQDAIFYQIFPDRFADGDPSNNPANVQAWGTPPTIWGFQGGDLRGVIQKMDYLLDLGVSALYLNPIFRSTSNHRYNISDYFQIDPKLGDMKDFNALLDTAHANGMRVILDGVFNHCGRGFFAFNDILENQEHSPYRDWFHIRKHPVEAYSPGDAQDYLAWWGFKSMPKFNAANPQVRQFLMEVARYWIRQGADGWRLDVPNEIDDDDFWAEFRQTVKSVNRDAYLVGEIWTVDPRWVGERHFDGLMGYPLREELLAFLTVSSHTASQFAEKVDTLLKSYPRENLYAMYLPLGTHDTERVMTALGGDLRKVKLATMIQFAFPGAPAIYYGDEIGLSGGKDPECRAAFPWDHAHWNFELHEWVKRLAHLRKRLAVLRRGSYQRVKVDDRRRCLAFARLLGDDRLLVVVNSSQVPCHIRLPVCDLGWQDGQIVKNLLGEGEYIVSGDSLSVSLSPCSGVWLK